LQRMISHCSREDSSLIGFDLSYAPYLKNFEWGMLRYSARGVELSDEITKETRCYFYPLYIHDGYMKSNQLYLK
jgi:hypothetical protein